MFSSFLEKYFKLKEHLAFFENRHIFQLPKS